MSVLFKIRQLCMPSYLYFIISMFGLLLAAIQNISIGKNNQYSLGNFSCIVPSCIVIFMIKIIYILFWTWILNLICKSGHSGIAWFLIFLPFILFFILIGLVMLQQKHTQRKMQKHSNAFNVKR